MRHPLRAFAQSASRFARGFPILLVLFALGALTPQPAKAGVTADDQAAANVAVDLFVKGLNAAGLPITEQEAVIVKEIVGCGVSGADAGDCVKNMIIRVALQEAGASEDVKKVATCLLVDGKNAFDCGTKAVLGKLPAEAQPMASCLVDGGKIPDCAKKLAEGLLANKVPADVQPIVKCMIDRADPKACGTEFVQQQVLKNLPAGVREQAGAIVGCLGSAQQAANCVANAAAPDELKPLVTCATAPGANIGACMAQFAADQLPPGTPGVAKDMIGCIGQGADFAGCAKDKGIAAAQDLVRPEISQAEKDALQAALDLLDKLRPDAPMTIEAGPNKAATLQNILTVAEGVKEKKWGLVVKGAGPELAIIASNILLSIFISPSLAAVLSPAVAAMIHNDVAGAMQAWENVKGGDAVGLASTIFQWYYNSFIDKPCAILHADPQDSVCGDMATAIQEIAKAGEDVAKSLLKIPKGILEAVGLWGIVDTVGTVTFKFAKGAVEEFGKFLGLSKDEPQWVPDPKCGTDAMTPANYFANNYLVCATKATGNASKFGTVDTSPLDTKCKADFNACIAPKSRAAAQQSVDEACGTMATTLVDLAKGVSTGIADAAKAYTDMGGPAAYVDKLYNEAVNEKFGPASRDFCSPDFWNAGEKQAYLGDCGGFVNKLFPLRASSCSSLITTTSSASAACMANLDKSLANSPSLVGPDSEYCKRQQDWIGQHPCEFKKGGKKFGDPAANVWVDNLTIHCDSPRASLPWKPSDVPNLKPPPNKRQTFPQAKGGPQVKDCLDPRGCGGWNGVNNNTNETPLKKPPFKMLPPGKLPGTAAPKPPSVAGRPPGSQGSSGTNTSRAMDRLSGDGMGGGLKSTGSSGSNGAVSPGRKSSGSVAGRGGTITPSHPMGSSGISTVNSQSGNAPMGSSGISTSRPINNNAPARGGSSGPDGLIDYGGCSSCNKPNTFRQPK